MVTKDNNENRKNFIKKGEIFIFSSMIFTLLIFGLILLII